MKSNLFVVCSLVCSLAFTNAALSESKTFKGFELDEREEIKDVKLLSGKKDDVRFYQGKISSTIDAPIKEVLKQVTRFDERCNNEYKSKRELTDKKNDCAFHNPNLVESVISRDFKSEFESEAGEIDRFMITRRIYNREEFTHIDLVKVIEKKNDLGKKEYVISMTMLDEDKAKKLKKDPIEKDSAFLVTEGVFTIGELGPGKTKLEYVYSSETDHWLLNKSISSGEVFDSIAKNLSSLIGQIASSAVARTKVAKSSKTKDQ